MPGNKIRELRIKRGYSLNKFSKLTGISKSYLSFLEREIKSNPSLDILIKISEFLEVDIDYLVEENVTKFQNELRSQDRGKNLQQRIPLSDKV